MQQILENKKELFEKLPIHKAAMTLVIPTVISQLIMLVYNMADTWYIGQIGDPYQVAAVTVTYPIFMLMSALANLFGIGGSSLISRLLGNGKEDETGKIASFALWAAGGITLCYSLICLIFGREFLILLKTDNLTIQYAEDYLFWTVVIGGLPTVLSMVLASIIRSEGDARISSIGMSLGGILNMIMDPVFIFVFKMSIAGAALSTCLSNTVSLLFLLIHVIRKRKDSLIKISIFPSIIKRSHHNDIYAIGTPAALQILLAAVSNAFLLRLMSAYPVEAMSGMGVMQKVESIPFQVIMGISDGVLPLVAYNYAAANYKRMNEAVRFTLTRGILCALACFLLYEVTASGIVGFFINDSQSIAYGAYFVRIRVLALPFITVEFMLIAVFQGIGCAKQAFFLSIFRKGILDLPLMILFNRLLPMYGLMFVQPFMDLCGALIAWILYKKLKNRSVVTNMTFSTQSN